MPDEAIARAPGRVNLIGEHTDYNGGLVLPMAIDLVTEVRLRRRGDRRLVLRSTAKTQTIETALDDTMPQGGGAWGDYVRAVALALIRQGIEVPGADVWIESQVPEGAGLSSSAALEVATAMAFLDLVEVELEPRSIARLCQQAENDFVGTRCGIMDPLVSVLAESGRAMRLDCATLESRAVALPPDIAVLVADTGVRHALASGEYNRRRAECEAAFLVARRLSPEINFLAELKESDLERLGRDLEVLPLARARHVVRECARVEAVVAALESGQPQEAGRRMVESHASLRDDYAVSCPELDLLVELALAQSGVFGSRMTGGGFGGCTVSLVEQGRAADVRAAMDEAWRRARGQPLRSWEFRPGPGAFALRRASTNAGSAR